MGGGGSCGICKIVCALVTIGALNWGLVGIFQFDLVAQLLGPMSAASRTVYSLVGIAGVLAVLSYFKVCPCQKGRCETKK